MAIETIPGPSVTTGNVNPQQLTEFEAAACANAYADSIPDPRLISGFIGSAPSLTGNHLFSTTNQPYVVMVNAVPQAAANNRIALSANVVNGTPMTLVSAQGTGVSPNIPVNPFPTSTSLGSAPVTALALDFGFTTGTTVASSTAITIPAGAYRYFYKGQNLIISGAGAAANTPLLCSVVSCPPGGTTLNVSVAAGQSVSGAQIGSADPNTGKGAWPYRAAGPHVSAKNYVVDPNQILSRAISITGSASGTGGAFIVSGFDIYGMPMSETITATAGATTTNGKKAWKYITSVVPQFTDAHGYSVGTQDVFGFASRSDFYEYMNIVWAGGNIVSSTGWLAADPTTPATKTTGDVRGTYAVQSASNGSNRLVIMASIADFNLYGYSNLDASSLLGVTQA